MSITKTIFRSAAALTIAAMVIAAGGAQAGEGYSAAYATKAPPTEIAEEIRAELSDQALEINGPDGLRYEFWFAKSIQLTAAPDGKEDLSKIPEIVLIGAARVADVANLDFREDEVPAGVYTMRFGLQPEDGNHLGTSPYPFFAILIPAERDQELNGIADHDDMVDRSMEDTAGVHPYILAMQPLPDGATEFPAISEGEHDWKLVHVELNANVKDGGAEAKLQTAIVFEGIGDI